MAKSFRLVLQLIADFRVAAKLLRKTKSVGRKEISMELKGEKSNRHSKWNNCCSFATIVYWRTIDRCTQEVQLHYTASEGMMMMLHQHVRPHSVSVHFIHGLLNSVVDRWRQAYKAKLTSNVVTTSATKHICMQTIHMWKIAKYIYILAMRGE